MQADRSALGASLILGVVWAVWHLPLYLIGADLRPLSLFPAWVLIGAAASVIYTWMYNGTGGSLSIIILFHAASNLPLTILLEPLEDEITQPFLIYAALTILAASVVVAARDRRLSPAPTPGRSQYPDRRSARSAATAMTLNGGEFSSPPEPGGHHLRHRELHAFGVHVQAAFAP
jgi:hypothetical protein